MLSCLVQARPTQKCLHFESWGIVLIRKENIAGREKVKEQTMLQQPPCTILWVPGRAGEARLVVFADSHGVNTPTMA